MSLIELYKNGRYEEVIREVDSRFGWESDDIGRTTFTKEKAEWCLTQIGEEIA